MITKSALSGLLGSLRSAADQGAKDLAAYRARIADCRRRIADAEHAPMDAKTIERRATELVDSTIAAVRSRGGLLDVLASRDERYSQNNAAVSAEQIRSFELACLMNRTAAIACLTREAIAAGGDSGLEPLDEAKRAGIITKLTAEARSFSALEEQLIRQLEGAGLSTTRRPDADPEIILAHDHELQALSEA